MKDPDSTPPSGGPSDPAPGPTLTLRDASGNVIATVLTAADGIYSFTNPSPPAQQAVPAAPSGHVSGAVYLDADRDGQHGTGDPGCSGVAIGLSGTDAHGRTVQMRTTTDSNGRYSFDGLSAGHYRLELLEEVPNTQPGRCQVGTLGGQESGGALQFTMTAGQKGERYDFARVPPPPAAVAPPAPRAPAVDARDLLFSALGNESVGLAALFGSRSYTPPPPAPPAPAVLSGIVFHDGDCDGRLGDGDHGLVGVTVLLEGVAAGGTRVSRSTTTGEDGAYTFADLPPGTYSLTRQPAASFLAGQALVGTINGVPAGQGGEDGVRQVVLAPGAVAQNYNFAEVRAAGLTGVVTLEEQDDDGPLEEPLPDVTVLLAGTDARGRAVQLSTQTDERGTYRFRDLFPGRYDVYATPPRGGGSKEARPGDKGGRASGSGKVSGVVLRSGETGSRYNFRVQPTGSLSGRVVGPPGVRVVLTGCDQTRTTTTNDDGAYRFTGLRPGHYRLEADVEGGPRVIESFTLGSGASGVIPDLE